jgi:hypothetical protein
MSFCPAAIQAIFVSALNTIINMYSINIDTDFVAIINNVNGSDDAYMQAHGIALSNEKGFVAIRQAGKFIAIAPSNISDINGTALPGGLNASDIIAIIAAAIDLAQAAVNVSGIAVLAVTASAGTTISNAALSGKTVHAVLFNNISATTGFNLSGSTITFTDGTTFGGGESVKILFS